jgi:hypothetical protein
LLFRLALAFGEPEPDNLLDKMSVTTFREWADFFRVEPGTLNLNNQVALLLTMISKKGKFKDFGGVEREWSDEEIEKRMKAYCGWRAAKT